MMAGNAVKKYKRPEIVAGSDGRKSLSKPVWNHDTMAEHVMATGLVKWIKVGELARLVWGRSNDNFRRDVRRRLPNLKRHIALAHNHLLLVEYNDPRGAASAVKIYDPAKTADVQAMHRMLTDMMARKDALLNYYEKVTGLSGLVEE
jgi:hypothetical protein